MTVIADSAKPVAIAGVMGGRDTEVDESTTDIFIEVAVFDPARTRQTRRLAGLSTDASYRFERGVDVVNAPRALERVASLVVALAGGTIGNAPVDLYAGDPPRVPIVLRASRLVRLLGVALPADRIAALLRSIGCQADVEEGGAAVHVVAPSWRRDLIAEVDLVEEVARLHGYDELPDEIRPYRPGTSVDAPLWGTSARIRERLVGAGLLEVKPIPFVGGGDEHVRILNPLAENEGHLRRTLLETLARRAEHNLAHMQGNVRLFEIGSVFVLTGDALPREEMRVAALVMGQRRPPHFTDANPPAFDVWDAKALAELVAEAVAPGAAVRLVPADAPDADLLWTIQTDGSRTGEVRRVPLDAPVWASPAFGVELLVVPVSNDDVAPAGEHAHGVATGAVRPAARAFTPLPTTPASEFDLALLVPESLPAAEVERVIRESAGDLLERLVAFDLFQGEGIEAGARSIAWRLTLRHPERTLRDKEIEGRRARILSALSSELNVRQRSS
jgi:phenylalanyl-tRNA synthetase beta chain